MVELNFHSDFTKNSSVNASLIHFLLLKGFYLRSFKEH